MSAPVGQRLPGTPYELLGELGRGGMGIVFEATDRERGDVCAVKLIRKDANPAADVVDRLKLEAETLEKVRSAHFVGFRGAGFAESGAPYYAMERLVGRSLRAELTARGALPLKEALVIAIQMFDGLADAHAIGVVHRDIKPDNTFLCDGSDPRLVRLLDLGVAKVVEQKKDGPAPRLVPTAMGLMVGSLRWAAPEVVAGGTVDGRTDIYSAGLVLFAMVSGQSPFEHATTKETLTDAQLKEPLPKLSLLMADTELGALDAIIAGATVKARRSRTRTARDVAVELRHHLRERFGVDLPPIARGDNPRLVPASTDRPVSTPVSERSPSGRPSVPFPILNPGERFEQRYEIISHLGDGGMGTVYRARHLFLGREIAIKLIPLDSKAAGGDFRNQFALEMQLLAKVDHPNVVKIHDGGVTADGNAYIVMELLPGKSLRESLRGERALDDGTARSYLRQVAEGLAALHAIPILHRDIKPENIVVGSDGSVKIVDFGLARVRTKSKYATVNPNSVGTLHYMPKEQLLNEPLDESVDVYAFGLVMFECFTGAHPRATLSGAFQNRTEAIRSVVDGLPLEPIERRRPDLPAEFGAFWRTCVVDDPHERPKAAELVRFFSADGGGKNTDVVGDATEVSTTPPVHRADDTAPDSPPPRKLSATVRDDRPMPLPNAERPLAAPVAPSPRHAAPAAGGPRPAPHRRGPLPLMLGVIVFALAVALAVEVLRPGTFFASPAPSSSPTPLVTATPKASKRGDAQTRLEADDEATLPTPPSSALAPRATATGAGPGRVPQAPGQLPAPQEPVGQEPQAPPTPPVVIPPPAPPKPDPGSFR